MDMVDNFSFPVIVLNLIGLENIRVVEIYDQALESEYVEWKILGLYWEMELKKINIVNKSNKKWNKIVIPCGFDNHNSYANSFFW